MRIAPSPKLAEAKYETQMKEEKNSALTSLSVAPWKELVCWRRSAAVVYRRIHLRRKSTLDRYIRLLWTLAVHIGAPKLMFDAKVYDVLVCCSYSGCASNVLTKTLLLHIRHCLTAIVMAALWNRAGHYIFVLWFFMAALRSTCGHYIFILWFLLSFYLFFSPNFSHCRSMSTILLQMVWP